ncbi:MAG: GrdX family protein [Fusobacteriaceae bacterium]|nr:GrdX family protein [Fusobacteriaceae bacterium]
MEIIIITNNNKVYNFYKETNTTLFYQKKDLIELLEIIKEKIYNGHRLLSDPIFSSLERPENPYKSVAISKIIFEDNRDHQKLIDGAISIAKKIENRKKFYDFKENNLEEYRFIDLNLLSDIIKDMD